MEKKSSRDDESCSPLVLTTSEQERGLPRDHIFHHLGSKEVVWFGRFNLEIIPQTQPTRATLSLRNLWFFDNGAEVQTEMSLLKCTWHSFVAQLLPFSIIVEDTRVPALQHIYFPTCRVRCPQFLPTRSLFVLLSLDIKFRALCWWHLAPHLASVTDSHAESAETAVLDISRCDAFMGRWKNALFPVVCSAKLKLMCATMFRALLSSTGLSN